MEVHKYWGLQVLVDVIHENFILEFFTLFPHDLNLLSDICHLSMNPLAVLNELNFNLVSFYEFKVDVE